MQLVNSIAILMILISSTFSQNINTTLVANLDSYPGIGYTDCWGYTAPDSREYAFLGVNAGVSIVDVSNVNDVKEVTFIPFVNFGWYDMKTYRNYLYVSSEGTLEILIIDLSALPDSAIVLGSYAGLTSEPHNIYIDTTQAILYAIEDFNFNAPVRILSLANPENPVELSFLGPGLGTDAHDVFAQDSTLYVAEGVNGSVGIFDVSNPSAPSLLQRIDIPSPGYVHNVWVSEDNKTLISTEETANKTAKMWDISNLDNIKLIGEYLGGSKLVHNAMIKENYVYISHYQSGLKIVDLLDPTSPLEIGNYDTFPQSEGSGFAGAWGVYPFNRDGKIFISDMQTGLYVVQFNNAKAYRVTGVLTDATTGQTLENGWIEIVESGKVVRSDAAGLFKTGFPASGSITLRYTAFGYDVSEIPLTAIEGTQDSIEISLQPTATSAITGIIQSAANQPIENATLTLDITSPLFIEPLQIQTNTDQNGQFNFADLPISDETWVIYDRLVVDKKFPFLGASAGNISVVSGNPTTIDFELTRADLLLVNDDMNNNLTIYQQVLQDLGLNPYEWATFSDGLNIPVDSMSQLENNVMIWYTGEAEQDVLLPMEISKISQHLDNNGKLILTGKNIAEYLDAQNDPFLSDVLEVNYGGTFIGSPLISPVDTNQAVTSLTSFPVVHDSKDILVPLAGGKAVPAFSYASGEVAGVTIEKTADASKIVFLGFQFEKIAPAANLTSVMGTLLNWFDISTDITPASISKIPTDFHLNQNYPNPFNPSTRIQYHVPAQSKVVLKIFNVLGQEVTTLVEERKQPGTYTIEWNATDNRGSLVPTGIYFYRLFVESLTTKSGHYVAGETASFSDMKKMILVR